MRRIYKILLLIFSAVLIVWFLFNKFKKPVRVDYKQACVVQQIPASDYLLFVQDNLFSFAGVTIKKAFVLASDCELFGGISAVKHLNANQFMMLSDAGYFMQGRVATFANQTINSLWQLYPMLKEPGSHIVKLAKGDAESLLIVGDSFKVGTEKVFAKDSRSPILNYYFSNNAMQLHSFDKTNQMMKGLPVGFGIEALALLDNGCYLAFSERKNHYKGHTIWENCKDEISEYTIKVSDGFSISDAAFSNQHGLFVLLRKVGVYGFMTRIMHISREQIDRKDFSGAYFDIGNTFTGFDNTEGIDILSETNSSVEFVLLSDNNFNFMQRNLLVVLELDLKK